MDLDETIGTLHETLGNLVCTDIAALSDGEVHRQLVEVTAALSRLQAVQLKLADSWTTRGVWAEDGSATPRPVSLAKHIYGGQQRRS